MARGKLKFRDVVGGSKKNNKKQTKRKPRARKTYSLYQEKNKKNFQKRKFETESENEIQKKQKVEEKLPAENDSYESEEEDDHMQQLRSTFSSKLISKQFKSIDSSDEESDEEEEGELQKVQTEEMNGDNFEHYEDSDEEMTEKINSTNKNNDNENLIEDKDDEENETDGVRNEEEHSDDANDPFVKQVCYDLHESVLNSLQNVPVLLKNHTETWPTLGRLLIQIPQFKEFEKNTTNTFSIEEEKKFAPPAQVPQRIKVSDHTKLENIFIKNQIIDNLAAANTALREDNALFTDLQNELFSIINNYQDLYYSERNFSKAEEIRFVYCLHSINHILKTRLKVVHHNSRLSKKDDVPEEFRDQGLVRPKILMVVPFKDSACRIIQILINILLPDDKGHVINKKRFLEEYTGNELVLPKKNPKPEDYESTFSGNTNDDFRIGMTVTKKSLKLYADFYSSDIIIASPLGLRTIIGAEGEPERDYDFLASIELLILDQVELFYMQNWDHFNHVLNHLHLQPKEAHGTDFSRVRTWSLNGWAKYYRQTLIFSSVVLPEINAIFNKRCNNHSGKVKVLNPIEYGSICQVFVQIPHVFHKFEATSAQEVTEARFDFFVNKILPQQKDSLMKQTLVFVSSYFDYVRLRNYFKKEDVGFVQICEYSKEGKIARARDMFYHGDAHFLLYTERYHFFNRIRIKGIRHLIFYELPVFPHFYYEMCNLMQEGNMNKKIGSASNMTVNVLYSKYDIHRLAAVVGSDKASKMLQSDRNVHMMVTGAD